MPSLAYDNDLSDAFVGFDATNENAQTHLLITQYDGENKIEMGIRGEEITELQHTLNTQFSLWHSKNDKPRNRQDVLVLMLKDGGGQLIEIKQSLYFDSETLKGFGDVDTGEGLLDESKILLWIPYYTPPAPMVAKALEKAKES